MLSQIRQISDGNYNTVFVKNKEQKFNLDKEIHDLECWKQSRNHVYRKEERELLSHLEKLRHQQEYLHHLDEERERHIRGDGHGTKKTRARGSQAFAGTKIEITHAGKDNQMPPAVNVQDADGNPQQMQPSENAAVPLPPVRSNTDAKTLHRTDAYTNICVVCQLPRRSFTKYGYHSSREVVCCCEHEGEEEQKSRGRRLSLGNFEGHGTKQAPVEVGQRRHSLMMARLNDERYEYKPHPPDDSHKGHGRRSRRKSDSAGHPHDHHGHVHDHHDYGHHHHRHVHHHHDHVHHHHGHVHNHGHTHRHHHHNLGHVHQHYDHVHRNAYGGFHGHQESGHLNANKALGHSSHHSHHGHQMGDFTQTPNSSPQRPFHHSLSQQGHYNTPMSIHDPLYSAPPLAGQKYHSVARRASDTAGHSLGSLGTGVHDSSSDSRRRDHELHWDRHQVCMLKGMITDPHYKEQLDVEGARIYPWSSQYPARMASSEDIQDLKNCRYLRFSRMNLENMAENPEEEVEVFDKKDSQ